MRKTDVFKLHFRSPKHVFSFLGQGPSDKKSTAQTKPPTAAEPIANVSVADPEKAKKLAAPDHWLIIGVLTIMCSASSQAFHSVLY